MVIIHLVTVGQVRAWFGRARAASRQKVGVVTRSKRALNAQRKSKSATPRQSENGQSASRSVLFEGTHFLQTRSEPATDTLSPNIQQAPFLERAWSENESHLPLMPQPSDGLSLAETSSSDAAIAFRSAISSRIDVSRGSFDLQQTSSNQLSTVISAAPCVETSSWVPSAVEKRAPQISDSGYETQGHLTSQRQTVSSTFPSSSFRDPKYHTLNPLPSWRLDVNDCSLSRSALSSFDDLISRESGPGSVYTEHPKVRLSEAVLPEECFQPEKLASLNTSCQLNLTLPPIDATLVSLSNTGIDQTIPLHNEEPQELQALQIGRPSPAALCFEPSSPPLRLWTKGFAVHTDHSEVAMPLGSANSDENSWPDAQSPWTLATRYLDDVVSNNALFYFPHYSQQTSPCDTRSKIDFDNLNRGASSSLFTSSIPNYT